MGLLPQKFPHLISLGLTDEVLSRLPVSLPRKGDNTILEVLGPDPELEWLTGDLAAKIILRLEHPPLFWNENLDQVSRLIVPASEASLDFLSGARKFDWLLFITDESLGAPFLAELGAMIRGGSLDAEVLEFVELDRMGEFNYSSLRSSRARSEQLEVIESLMSAVRD